MNFRKIILIVTSLFILVGILIKSAPVIKAITIDDLLPQITNLQNQINQLKKQIAEIEKTINSLAESISQLTRKVTITPKPEVTAENIEEQISSITETISYLTQDLQKISPTPTKPESEFKCPDITGDGKVDIKDIAIISKGINTCAGQTNYDARGDVDGDNCLTNTDLSFVSKYFGKLSKDISQCQGIVIPVLPTLSVSLSASPSSGTAPLNGVDLMAIVSGTASGYINYTFYCNRLDIGTDLTSGWCQKKDGLSQTTYTAIGCCNFSSAGIYMVKIIVERGSLQAEARTTVQVNAPVTVKSESEFKCPDITGDGKVDIKDIAIISKGINTCAGQTNYDARGDVDGDNCLTNTDLSFVSKYFGKNASEIEQCK